MIEKIESFLSNSNLINLIKEHHQQIQYRSDISFNIFSFISEKYHHENFHSEIIAALLDSSSNHGELDKFLLEFLKLINRIKPLVNISDFKNAQVFKESDGRIDIFIKDEISKKAIIIENKINNAVDTHDQLPKYWRKTKNNGYDVVAIVYLPLDTNKSPNKDDWKEDDREKINQLLVIIPVFNGSDNDLLNGWIKRCELVSKNIDALCVIKQYGEILNNISVNNMDNIILEKFHKVVLDNYEIVMETNKLFNELPQHLAYKITERYRDKTPFTKVWIWSKTVAVIDRYLVNEHCFSIDVFCSLHKYSFQFFDRNYDGFNNTTKKLLEEIGFVNELAWDGKRFLKDFKFPQQEEDLFSFIDDFIRSLQNNSTQIE